MMKNLRCKFPENVFSFIILTIVHFRALNSEQKSLSDGLILFSVKDKDLLGYNNQYIGEAFLPFTEVQETTESLDALPQVHLLLSRPTDSSEYEKPPLNYIQTDLNKYRYFLR